MYINIQTQQQLTESEIRSLFPNTSFAQPFAPPEGYAVVFASPQPTVTLTQVAVQSAPVLTVKGHWEQTWLVQDKFSDYTDPEGITVTKAEQEAKVIADDAAAKSKALQSGIITATQQRLDDFAKTKNYDGILSACTYATDPNPVFAAEGQKAVALRSATWAALYAILAEVEAGTRAAPTGYADIEAELPVLSWV